MIKKIETYLVSAVLAAVMMYGFIGSKTYELTGGMIRSAWADITDAHGEEGEENIPTCTERAKQLNNALNFKDGMIGLNGTVCKDLGLREIYADNGGVVLKNGYSVVLHDYTSTDYEVENMIALKNYLDEYNIPLLYVNAPTKYISDYYAEQDLGLPTYTNDNADRFLARIREAGIAAIDLRENLDPEDSFSSFYRADHHWTVPAGLMAARETMRALNENFGYDIDLSLYDESQFTFKSYENAWLGEQGRKFGLTYIGLDDFVSVLPKYETNFTRKGKDGLTGTFAEALVNLSCYLPENNTNPYKAGSWHYSYKGKKGTIINNLNPDGKKILVIGDSFTEVSNTFLALGAAKVRCVDLRKKNIDLEKIISSGKYDTVVVQYAVFMIGAHDDPTSSNRNLFNFFNA